MSVQEGLELRDQLGWQSSPTRESMFTTGHDLGGKDASFFTLKGQIGSFRMGVASRIPKASAPAQAPTLVRQAYDQYVQALTELYGTGTTKRSQGRNGPPRVHHLDPAERSITPTRHRRANPQRHRGLTCCQPCGRGRTPLLRGGGGVPNRAPATAPRSPRCLRPPRSSAGLRTGIMLPEMDGKA
ncbi:DUF6301 family protein [Actinomyces ruminis]|uniref:DUF6301 family protein n=1 Tax=Actinomyces ruminis TaxID=1937003 RepID=UPI00211ED3F6|nr:DUF6301 family protein [Actinomyces ruminis]